MRCMTRISQQECEIRFCVAERFRIRISVHIYCEALLREGGSILLGDKRRNEDRKLSVSVLDVFILVLTLSTRTVVFCGVLSIQHQQSADAKFNRHCNPHSGETKAFD